MASPKSLGGDTLYADLFLNVLSDSHHLYPSRKDLDLDCATVRRRVETEGLTFLTKSLPQLGKAFDEALETGFFVLPEGHKPYDKRRNVPTLFKSWFDPVLGVEGRLAEVSPERVKSIRQACFLLYKLELGYSPAQEEAVLQSFLDTEEELGSWMFPFDDWDVQGARDLVAELLSWFNPRQMVPRHGPGAVASGQKGDAKWCFGTFYADLHAQLPYDEYFFVGGSLDSAEVMRQWTSMERKDHSRSKVVLVPKDSRGPRLIAVEELEKQFVQQGVGRALVRYLSTHLWTSGRINFRDQEINRQLALESSRTQEFATLDLKDASDRVSLALVEFLLPEELVQVLKACRSTETVLPNGRVVNLKKHASMGSALCFPIEALVFWALSVSAIAHSRGCKPTAVMDSVFVFGDDLIVKSSDMDIVVEALEKVGLRVNLQKSFHAGHFRESCGMDAYNGVDVTPQRIRSAWNGRPGDGEVFASYVAYANGLAARGYSKAALYLRQLVERTYGPLPYGTSFAGYPCIECQTWEEAVLLNRVYGQVRKSPVCEHSYQQLQVHCKYLRSPEIPVRLDSWRRLVRNLTSGPGDDPSSVTHPHSVQLRRGWVRIA
jgi:hypothetical protein